MFKKSHPLQSKSEIILRNIVVVAMVAFFTIFLIIPIGIAFAGSFHEWNPLSGTYKFLGLENYKQVFTSKLFGKSMFNTVIFSVVVIIFRVGLGLGIAYAIYSTLIKHKSFFRAVYYMPVVTPMVAVAFVWKFMYNPQIGTINKIFGSLRAGRATPSLLDKVMVDYYGTPTPVNQVAKVSVPEPRMIVIQPWEKNLIHDIELAIMKSDLGLSPNSDGTAIRLSIPQLTQERRQEYKAQANGRWRKGKVVVLTNEFTASAADDLRYQSPIWHQPPS